MTAESIAILVSIALFLVGIACLCVYPIQLKRESARTIDGLRREIASWRETNSIMTKDFNFLADRNRLLTDRNSTLERAIAEQDAIRNRVADLNEIVLHIKKILEKGGFIQ